MIEAQFSALGVRQQYRVVFADILQVIVE